MSLPFKNHSRANVGKYCQYFNFFPSWDLGHDGNMCYYVFDFLNHMEHCWILSFRLSLFYDMLQCVHIVHSNFRFCYIWISQRKGFMSEGDDIRNVRKRRWWKFKKKSYSSFKRPSIPHVALIRNTIFYKEWVLKHLMGQVHTKIVANLWKNNHNFIESPRRKKTILKENIWNWDILKSLPY